MSTTQCGNFLAGPPGDPSKLDARLANGPGDRAPTWDLRLSPATAKELHLNTTHFNAALTTTNGSGTHHISPSNGSLPQHSPFHRNSVNGNNGTYAPVLPNSSAFSPSKHHHQYPPGSGGAAFGGHVSPRSGPWSALRLSTQVWQQQDSNGHPEGLSPRQQQQQQYGSGAVHRSPIPLSTVGAYSSNGSNGSAHPRSWHSSPGQSSMQDEKCSPRSAGILQPSAIYASPGAAAAAAANLLHLQPQMSSPTTTGYLSTTPSLNTSGTLPNAGSLLSPNRNQASIQHYHSQSQGSLLAAAAAAQTSPNTHPQAQLPPSPQQQQQQPCNPLLSPRFLSPNNVHHPHPQQHDMNSNGGVSPKDYSSSSPRLKPPAFAYTSSLELPPVSMMDFGSMDTTSAQTTTTPTKGERATTGSAAPTPSTPTPTPPTSVSMAVTNTHSRQLQSQPQQHSPASQNNSGVRSTNSGHEALTVTPSLPHTEGSNNTGEAISPPAQLKLEEMVDDESEPTDPTTTGPTISDDSTVHSTTTPAIATTTGNTASPTTLETSGGGQGLSPSSLSPFPTKLASELNGDVEYPSGSEVTSSTPTVTTTAVPQINTFDNQDQDKSTCATTHTVSETLSPKLLEAANSSQETITSTTTSPSARAEDVPEKSDENFMMEEDDDEGETPLVVSEDVEMGEADVANQDDDVHVNSEVVKTVAVTTVAGEAISPPLPPPPPGPPHQSVAMEDQTLAETAKRINQDILLKLADVSNSRIASELQAKIASERAVAATSADLQRALTQLSSGDSVTTSVIPSSPTHHELMAQRALANMNLLTGSPTTTAARNACMSTLTGSGKDPPVLKCNVCGYTNTSKFHFNSHMNTHFDHRCPLCDYTSRTEGRLKQHMKTSHDAAEVASLGLIGPSLTMTTQSPIAQAAAKQQMSLAAAGSPGDMVSSLSQEFLSKSLENNDQQQQQHLLGGFGGQAPMDVTDEDVGSCSSMGGVGGDSPDGSLMGPGLGGAELPSKPKTYKCKQCGYLAKSKNDSWTHARKHIKPDKQLKCPHCLFVTEYKHHLEYHLRNHVGSKPFRCSKCNYSCVNKSMLNSHMKSHSNYYQYRCNDCTYATKYCHSLKLHLRKYNHQPAQIVGQDGTVMDANSMDIYGGRRGPRRGESRISPRSPGGSVPSSGAQGVLSPYTSPFMDMGHSIAPLGATLPTVSSSTVSIPPEFLTGAPNISLEAIAAASRNGPGSLFSPTSVTTSGASSDLYNCKLCPFVTESKEELHSHALAHVLHLNPQNMSPRGSLPGGQLSHNNNGDALTSPTGLENIFSLSPLQQKGLLQGRSFSVSGGYAGGHRALAMREGEPPKSISADTTMSLSASSTPVKGSSRPPAQLSLQQSDRVAHDGSPSTSIPVSPPGSVEGQQSTKSPGSGSGSGGKSGDECFGDVGGGVIQSTGGSSRRKGKAIKLDQIALQLREQKRNSPSPDPALNSDALASSAPSVVPTAVALENDESAPEVPDKGSTTKSGSGTTNSGTPAAFQSRDSGPQSVNWTSAYVCPFCEIAFKQMILHQLHMGYHGYQDPFRCNRCGHTCANPTEFSAHIASERHCKLPYHRDMRAYIGGRGDNQGADLRVFF